MEQLANGRVQSVTVVTDRYCPEIWKIGIILSQIDGEMHLIPFISYRDGYYPQCRLGYYLGIKNLDYCTKKVDLPSECQAPGFCLKFLDLKPELLDDGALIIEYGIRVEAIQRTNNIWTFQLWNDLFDSNGKQVMVPFRENERGRCHPQIKAIHDKSIEVKRVYIDFSIPLQIAHGVRYQIIGVLDSVSRDAYKMGLRNVVQYCQWQLIRKQSNYSVFRKFFIALHCEMRICLADSIREINSKEELMEILKEVDIDKMSGESMKTFMKFLLYE